MERYSRVNYPRLKELKKILKKHNDPMSYFVEEDLKGFKDNLDKSAFYNEMIFYFSEYSVPNFFISSSELSNMFLETKIKMSIKEIIETLKSNGFKSDHGYGFAGKIFTKSFKRTFFFNILFYDDLECLNIYITDGEYNNGVTLTDDVIKKINKYIYTSRGIWESFPLYRLVINLLFYIKAFPENVLNSPPDEECDKLNKDNSKTISISPTISEYLHENRDVQPHLRRGHFRYLGSDYFNKKRGQTIFVKASFVRGDAKTVV